MINPIIAEIIHSDLGYPRKLSGLLKSGWRFIGGADFLCGL